MMKLTLKDYDSQKRPGPWTAWKFWGEISTAMKLACVIGSLHVNQGKWPDMADVTVDDLIAEIEAIPLNDKAFDLHGNFIQSYRTNRILRDTVELVMLTMQLRCNSRTTLMVYYLRLYILLTRSSELQFALSHIGTYIATIHERCDLLALKMLLPNGCRIDLTRDNDWLVEDPRTPQIPIEHRSMKINEFPISSTAALIIAILRYRRALLADDLPYLPRMTNDYQKDGFKAVRDLYQNIYNPAGAAS